MMRSLKDLLASPQSYASNLARPEWQRFSAAMRRTKGSACECCKRGYIELQLHHVFYDPQREPWEYDSSEVVLLCAGCHRELHEQLKAFRKFVFRKLNPQSFAVLNGALAVALDKHKPLVFAHALAEFVASPGLVDRYAAAWTNQKNSVGV